MKNDLIWKNVKEELPVIDDEHEEGDIPYLGIYGDEEDYEGNEVEDFDSMGIVYYYGNGHWKNSRWERVYVSYWLEIPPIPSKLNWSPFI